MRYPQEVIPTFDMAANETFFESYPAATLNHQIQVRPFNASKTRNMRCLDPEGNLFILFNFFQILLNLLLSVSSRFTKFFFINLFYFYQNRFWKILKKLNKCLIKYSKIKR